MAIVISHITAIEYWLANASLKPDAVAASSLHALPSANPSTRQRQEAVQLLRRCVGIPLHIVAAKPFHNGASTVCHLQTTPIQARSLFKIADGIYTCSPELAYLQACATLSALDAVRLGCELTSTYTIDRRFPGGFFQRDPVTTISRLQAAIAEAPAMRGAKTARWAAKHILPNAASPAETRVALALSLPCRIGGMGLPKPTLNQFISLNAKERKELKRSYFRCDLYWDSAKLAVEYDSDAEHTGSDRIAQDAARRAALLRLGVQVITIGARTFRDRAEFNETGQIIARQLGTRIRPRCEDFDKKQIELRRGLTTQPIWEQGRNRQPMHRKGGFEIHTPQTQS